MHSPSLLIINFTVYVCYCPYINFSFMAYNDLNSCISCHYCTELFTVWYFAMTIHVQSCTVHFTQCFQNYLLRLNSIYIMTLYVLVYFHACYHNNYYNSNNTCTSVFVTVIISGWGGYYVMPTIRPVPIIRE